MIVWFQLNNDRGSQCNKSPLCQIVCNKTKDYDEKGGTCVESNATMRKAQSRWVALPNLEEVKFTQNKKNLTRWPEAVLCLYMVIVAFTSKPFKGQSDPFNSPTYPSWTCQKTSGQCPPFGHMQNSPLVPLFDPSKLHVLRITIILVLTTKCSIKMVPLELCLSTFPPYTYPDL